MKNETISRILKAPLLLLVFIAFLFSVTDNLFSTAILGIVLAAYFIGVYVMREKK